MKYKKKIGFLACILGICLTATNTSYAYFNSKVDLSNVLSSDGEKTLNINNGLIQMSFSDENGNWRNVGENNVIVSPDSTGSAIYNVSNKDESPTLEYGPVKLMSTENSSSTNLTTKVNLAIDFGFGMKIEGGSTPEEPEPSDTFNKEAEGFEVMVGDMDNFNAKVKVADPNKYEFVDESIPYGGKDPYSGELPDQIHSLEIYPKSYDAIGTDRRMTPSGFYSVLQKISKNNNLKLDYTNNDFAKANNNITDYKNWWYWKKRIDSETGNAGVLGGLWDYSDSSSENYSEKEGYTGRAYYRFNLKDKLSFAANETYDGKAVELPSGYSFFYEGYTDRGIRGNKQNWKEKADEHSIDKSGVKKNWSYIQKVEPLTFKYNEFEGDITSAKFQIYFDDLQSGDSISAEEAVLRHKFVDCSSSRFTVYINGVEIPEMSDVVNSFNQSGPKGCMVNLAVPSKYLYLIKESAGLDNGLTMLIDDKRIGTSGDSYSIDFAKLTVNSTEKSSTVVGKVSGKVLNSLSGRPVAGVLVTSSDGQTATTNSDGEYEFSTSNYNAISPGITTLTFSKSGYLNNSYRSSSLDATKNDGGNFVKDKVYSIPDISITPTEVEDGTINGDTKVVAEIKVVEHSIKDDSSSGDMALGDYGIVSQPIINQENGTTTKTTTYNKIVYDGVKARQAELNLNMKPGIYYEISYKLKFNSQTVMNTFGSLNVDFYSKLCAKATQENNPNWNEDGTGENYESSYYGGTVTSKDENEEDNGLKGDYIIKGKVVGKNNIALENVKIRESSGANSRTNSNGEFTINTTYSKPSISFAKDGYKSLLKKVSEMDPSISGNTIDIGTITMEDLGYNLYFEMPNTKDSSGNNIWTGTPTAMYSENKTGALDKTINFETVTGASTETWYCGKLPEGKAFNESKIKITANNGNTSGELYPFNTARVFICTNGYTDINYVPVKKSKITVNYFDSKGNKISSKNYYGVPGTSREVECEEIKVGDSYYVPPNKSMKFKLDFKENDSSFDLQNCPYNRANVTINYVDENGEPLANSEYRYIENGIYNVKEGSIAVSSSAETKLTNYNYVKTTVGNNTTSVSIINININNTDVVINYIYKLYL